MYSISLHTFILNGDVMVFDPKELLTFGSEFYGKINDKVYYYRNTGADRILIVRPYCKPVQPGSGSQQARWNKFADGVHVWQNLRSEDQEYYRDRVRYLGYRMTGFNLFMSIFLKGGFDVIKNIYRGSQFVPQGLTNITITAVDLSKSVLIYNSFLAATDGPPPGVYGVEAAILSTPTNIAVNAWDTAVTGTVIFTWQIIEYV